MFVQEGSADMDPAGRSRELAGGRVGPGRASRREGEDATEQRTIHESPPVLLDAIREPRGHNKVTGGRMLKGVSFGIQRMYPCGRPRGRDGLYFFGIRLFTTKPAGRPSIGRTSNGRAPRHGPQPR